MAARQRKRESEWSIARPSRALADRVPRALMAGIKCNRADSGRYQRPHNDARNARMRLIMGDNTRRTKPVLGSTAAPDGDNCCFSLKIAAFAISLTGANIRAGPATLRGVYGSSAAGNGSFSRVYASLCVFTSVYLCTCLHKNLSLVMRAKSRAPIMGIWQHRLFPLKMFVKLAKL